MSDTEESSFDKEAEKEKLREQLRREEEERRSTQHMSELLLKGATMTNKHCDACGDPLFRYEGQEFCPTCTQDGATGAASDAEAAAGTVDGAESAGDSGVTAAGVDDGSTPGDAGIDRVETGGGTDSAPPASVGTPRDRQSSTGVPEDVGAARTALVRKLTTLARQAEATDDVGRSRELLAAAREAAEAIAAIDAVDG